MPIRSPLDAVNRGTCVKICHVCSGHPVDDGRVFHRACVSLAASGYDVHLLATASATEPYIEKGVTIHPLSKPKTRRERLSRSHEVARMAAAIQPDLYHVHEPDLLGPVLSRAQGKPVIYDVHESYVDVLKERRWIPPVLRPLASLAWNVWERRLVRKCAGIVVVTETIAQRYYPIHSNVRVVANFPEMPDLDGLLPPQRDGKTCVFAGGLNSDRGVFQVIEALAILRKRGMDVPFLVAGRPASEAFLESLWDEATRQGVRDLIDYRGILPQADVIGLLRGASIGLIPYLPVPNSIAGMPNKLVECMAVGIPVVFSNFPIYRQVAGESGAGLAVDPTKPQEIANAIEKLVSEPELASRMGEAGALAIKTRYNWQQEAKKQLELYSKILGRTN